MDFFGDRKIDYYSIMFSCICNLAGTAALTFVVFLGVFGFLNPDKEAWYGITEDGKEELFPSYELGVQAGATDLTDIHSRF